MSNPSAKAIRHLCKDHVLKDIIKQFKPLKLSKTGNVYRELVRSIIYQQISYKAADKIHERFIDLVGTQKFSPKHILQLDFDKLKSVGLSNQKTQYVINISQFFKERKLMRFDWSTLSDEEISDLLMEIKGVGQWTVDMILIFELGRDDVLPLKDLAIREAMKKIYNVKKEKKALVDALYKRAESWRPYRSVASLYLWSWYRVNG